MPYDRLSPFLLPILEAYEARVLRRDGCWGWTGNKDTYGYGIVWHEHTGYRAHRVGFFVANRYLDHDKLVLHRVGCESKSCTNPECLYQGNYYNNNRDTIAAGNHAGGARLGSQNHNSIFTEDAVREIRRRLAMKESRQKLADEYNTSYQNIRSIDLGITWKGVS